MVNIMTNQFAKIENGTVTNIILLPDGESLGFIRNTLNLGGVYIYAGDAQVGWELKNGKLVPPPEPEPEPYIPTSVTRRQGRLALLEADKLEAVENAITQAGAAAQIEYEADTWDRNNAFLNQLWEQLGGTQSELDDLFILAASK